MFSLAQLKTTSFTFLLRMVARCSKNGKCRVISHGCVSSLSPAYRTVQECARHAVGTIEGWACRLQARRARGGGVVHTLLVLCSVPSPSPDQAAVTLGRRTCSVPTSASSAGKCPPLHGTAPPAEPVDRLPTERRRSRGRRLGNSAREAVRCGDNVQGPAPRRPCRQRTPVLFGVITYQSGISGPVAPR